ncbi:C2 calcium-dependent domain-containing protein 4C [Cynoglossus semilaevis]|uniref:C2 calcium-dependent domain-containing protein 4C-like n=1 Tax=Cynoglossus semilaevis TaxID=244447 RepID=A0A3P8WD80_CYNSE|nr:C2 calcium-dependent domain-containing protein 4C-like [Cynoglossus semilaevis]
MWLFEKIRDSIENIPSELCHTIEQSKEYIFNSRKTCMSLNVHSNILTPDKIPEFCLPPRLSRRNILQEAETPSSHLLRKNQEQSTFFNSMQVMTKDSKVRNSNALMACKDVKRALPFSAESFGLAGIYQSPNTRRKESLFHPKFPAYTLNKKISPAAQKVTRERNPPKNTVAGFFSLTLGKTISETGSTENKTPSSTSCPVLPGSQEETGGMRREVVSLHTFPNNPPSSFGSSLTLAPTVLFPLDVLRCQVRLPREHVIPLQGRGKVKLSAESTTFSSNTILSLSTVRIRLVSVESHWNDTDQKPLNCALILCLTPGKLQLQKSATIKTSRNPVFNEDFYFTALSREDLLELQLRVKIVDKLVSGTLRRRTVIRVFTKPLSQLLHLHIN